MLITRTSTYSGRTYTQEFPSLTQERIDQWERTGEPIQRAFPELNADQREFLLTGMTPEEWKEAFGDEQ